MEFNRKGDLTGYVSHVFEEGGIFNRKYYATFHINLNENPEDIGLYFSRKLISKEDYKLFKEKLSNNIQLQIEGKLEFSLKTKN
jgi:hypothetical protein